MQACLRPLCASETSQRPMSRGASLFRDSIIAALTAELRRLPFVHAFCEGGSAAFDRVDEWSDIDLYIVVDDAAVPQTFLAVEKILASLSPIRINHPVSWPPATGIHQRFYHLEGSSEFLVVDLAVFAASAQDKFLAREIHGDPAVIFDKDGTTRAPALDKEGFVRGLLERRRRLAQQMELFGPFVKKELLRGNDLEAIEFYRVYVLRFLVEALRMQHSRCTTISECDTSTENCRPTLYIDSRDWRSSRIRRTSR